MNIIICGAGQVGFNLAKYLAGRNHNITVIDINQTLITKINDRLDVKAVCGHASHPDVLRRAGVENADMIIALTQADEVNMVACQIAHSIYDVPKKIARIRSQAYLNVSGKGLFTDENMPIDYIISPENEVAHTISRGLAVPGALDITPLTDNRIALLGVRCTVDTPVVNTPITHIPSLFPEVDFTIVGISRGDIKIIPSPTEVLMPRDEVYYIVDQERIDQSLNAFGYHGDTTKRLVILGGGNIGLFLAQEIEAHYPHIRIHIIERSPERATYIAQKLSRTIILNGDALDGEMLLEAGVQSADTVVAVTEDDRVNTLATVLAKRLGSKKAMCLANKTSFANLVISLGVDAVINPRVVTVSKIMQYIRRGNVHSVNSLGENFGEVIDVDASTASTLVGKTVQDLYENHKILIAAFIRNDQVVIPRQSSTVHLEDRVILMLAPEQAKRSEDLLGIG